MYGNFNIRDLLGKRYNRSFLIHSLYKRQEECSFSLSLNSALSVPVLMTKDPNLQRLAAFLLILQ